MLKLFNTLGRKVEEFKPLKDDEVSIYTCGPTVYDYQHIGNYSGYIYWDVLVRLLKADDYKVNRVMNITDVGHLVSDADEGEDKLEKGAKREGKTPQEVAQFYTDDFMQSYEALNLLPADKVAKATDFIPQQIEFIQRLLDKDFAYQTEQAIYFDTSKLADYGKLTGQDLSEKEVGARDEVVTDSAKHHPQDFALWFFRVGRFANHEMHWESPWGDGFPGWHIECSAIIHAVLGDPIDIHTGGIDHIGTHHTNEIAQTEAAYDHPLANFWLHNNHMMVDGKKISKSLGNGLTLKDLEEKGFTPMDFKMLVLQSHYRSQSNFTWDALKAAKTNLNDWYAWADQQFQGNVDRLDKDKEEALTQEVKSALSNDLNTAEALAAVNKKLGEGSPSSELLKTLDNYLGLDLSGRSDITDQQKDTIAQREEARQNQDWKKSDELRDELAQQGIGVQDTENGSIWYRL